jgi:hypothetical protein
MNEKQVAATPTQETTSDAADVIQATLSPPSPEHQRRDSHGFLGIRVLKSNHPGRFN